MREERCHVSRINLMTRAVFFTSSLLIYPILRPQNHATFFLIIRSLASLSTVCVLLLRFQYSFDDMLQ